MDKYAPFTEMSDSEVRQLRSCICFSGKKYAKDDIIMRMSDAGKELGIIDEGLAYLVRINIDGEKSIIDYYEKNDVFGKSLSPDMEAYSYYIQAKKSCEVTFFDYGKLLSRCENNCEKHAKLINNLILAAVKKSQLHIDVLSQRTIRDKLSSFFYYLSDGNTDENISVPMSLSDLADYLATDRSAMMREIKKMNTDGIITSKGSNIKLINI